MKCVYYLALIIALEIGKLLVGIALYKGVEIAIKISVTINRFFSYAQQV